MSNCEIRTFTSKRYRNQILNQIKERGKLKKYQDSDREIQSTNRADRKGSSGNGSQLQVRWGGHAHKAY